MRLWPILFLFFSTVHAVPLFNTITLDEYGAIQNQNQPIQPENRFNQDQLLRTNDFQVLQQEAADARQVIRINQFYVSQGPEGVGLTIPATQDNELVSITTPTDNEILTIGCVESTDLDITTDLLSSQAFTLTYMPPPPNTATNPQITPDETPTTAPEFFILYNNVIPSIDTNGVTIEKIVVDGVEVELAVNVIPEGRQFEITLNNDQFYALTATQSLLPIKFGLNEARTTLTARDPFSGFLRTSCATTPGTDETETARFDRNQVTPFLQTNDPTVVIDEIIIDGKRVIDFTMPLPTGTNYTLRLNTMEEWQIVTDFAIQFILSEDRTVFRADTSYSGTLTYGCTDPGTELTQLELLTASSILPVSPPTARIDGPLTNVGTFRDYNVIGNAFHDVEFNQLTPTLMFSASQVSRIFIDNLEQTIAAPDPFPAGTKFRIELTNGQIWLFYVEQSLTPLTLFLEDDFRTFRSVDTFTGFIRTAVIQVTPITNTGPTLRRLPPTSEFWSTGAITQTSPITPISLYLLYPYEWTTSFVSEMIANMPRSRFVPSFGQVAQLLPIIALHDFTNAFRYFQSIETSEYVLGTNPFQTFFLMILADRLSSDITTYQTTTRPPPVYGITPTAAATEATYDAHRTTIPITADIDFVEDLYTWTYDCLNNFQNPLILFPAYKTLFGTPITDFGYLDPIKGTLLGFEAVAGQITFAEGPVPLWYTLGFIPPFALAGRESSILQFAFDAVEDKKIVEGDVTSTGKQLLEFAQSVEFALNLFDRIPTLRNYVQDFTRPLINEIRTTLQAWLIDRSSSDFFIGDSTTPGVCTNPGLFAQDEGTAQVDDNNALYSNHHLQYGYWLAAVTTLIRWEARFLPPTEQWIAQPIDPTSTNRIIYKDFVDMLWRDARNPDADDPDMFNCNRHGNPWEGHSTENGLLYTPIATGRFAESLSTDFNSWAAVNQYARVILASTVLTTDDKVGFNILATFARTNMQLTATSGKLTYQDSTPIFGPPYSVNLTTGQTYDTQTLAAPTLERASPPAELLTR